MNWIRPFLLGVIITGLINVPIYFHFRNARIQAARLAGGGIEDVTWVAPPKLPSTRPVAPQSERSVHRPLAKPELSEISAREISAASSPLPGEPVSDDSTAAASPTIIYQFADRAVVGTPLIVHKGPLAGTIMPPREAQFSDPTALFAAIDKLKGKNWAAAERKVEKSVKPTGSKVQRAMFLGTLLAEEFIAIEAQDLEQIEAIHAGVLKFGKALQLSTELNAPQLEVMRAAHLGEWAGTRTEIEKEVKLVQAMKAAPFEAEEKAEVWDLIWLGAWFRSVEAQCTLVENTEAARTFALPVPQGYLLEPAAFGAATKKDPLFETAAALVQRISAEFNQGPVEASREKTVTGVRQLAKTAVEAIRTQSR